MAGALTMSRTEISAQGPDAAPVRANLALSALVIALNGVQFFVLPLVLLPMDPAWGLLLALVALSAPTHWSLIHEAIHSVLHPGRRANLVLGRALSVAFGSPFQLLRLGHLMHHRFNRSELNRVEVAPADEGVGPATRAGYYARLLGGLYLGELLASPLAISPRRCGRIIIAIAFDDEASDGRTMRDAARRQLLESPGRGRLQTDGALITAMLVLSFWAYGAHWWMLAAALAGRAFLVSFLDNVYHYGSTLDDVMAGTNLRAPAWMRRALLNFNYHATHHRHPVAPWTQLPALAGEAPAPPFLPAALRQLAGPIPEEHMPRKGAGPHGEAGAPAAA
jgi:hypothetical protein